MGATPEQVREWTDAGVYDPEATNADDRLELLMLVSDLGATTEQIVTAHERLDLSFLPIDLGMSADCELTLRDVAREAAWEPDELVDFLRLAGLPAPEPDEPWFRRSDVDTFRNLAAVGDLFDDDVTARLTRVLGASMGNLAEAVVVAFLAQVFHGEGGEDMTGMEQARYNLAAVNALDGTTPGISTILNLHLRASVDRWRTAAGDAHAGTIRLAIGFVDLVGYTSLSLHASPDGLRRMVEELEMTAYAVTADHHGRVVKLIGDAVMYATPSPAEACEIALAFVEAFSTQDGDITPRGGIALGDVVAWQGDYYGPIVNLSARIAELAVPNEVLVAGPLPSEATPDEQLAFAPAGRRLLKGFDEPIELWALHRP